jgi:Abortive infection alpha
MADDAPYDKAIQETAKAVQVVTPVLEKFEGRLSSFLHKILGEALEHLGGAFSDWAQTYRYENAMRLADRVDAIHRQRRLFGKTIAIAPRLAIPLLQGATLESDPALAEMWAGLTANATDPSKRVQARRTFIQLLGSLEPLDALVLMEVERHELAYPDRKSHNSFGKNSEVAWRSQWPNPSSIAAALGADTHDVALGLENLERLGLAVDDIQAGVTPVPLSHPEATIKMSVTGKALLAACRTTP